MVDSPTGPAAVLQVSWGEVVEHLMTCGWCVVPAAIGRHAVNDLLPPPGSRWQVLTDEGAVRQRGYQSYLSFAEAPAAVQRIGYEVLGGVDAVARRRGLPALPCFNEVTWVRYPPHVGHITRHRDPSAYHGLIAVLTLVGAATFRVHVDDERSLQYETGPGHLAMLRGAGWPDEHGSRPSHGADPPAGGERTIMTLRSNRRGAGAGYTV